MRAWLVLCTLALLMSLVLSKSHGRHPQRSMEVRNQDINTSWYTGRGIRPVGRFGRRDARVSRAPSRAVHRLCIPITAEDDSTSDQ